MAMNALGHSPAPLRSAPTPASGGDATTARVAGRNSDLGNERSASSPRSLTGSGHSHSVVPNWILTHHRAAPGVLLGMRSAHLVPTSGSLLASSSFSAAADAKPGSGSSKASGKSPNSAQDAESDGVAEGNTGQLQLGDEDAVRLAAVRGGLGDGAGDHANGQGGRGSAEQDGLRSALAAKDALGPSGMAGEVAPGQLLTADNLHRLDRETAYWTTSLRLAMACAVAHPGSDLFVQAFMLVDSEGNLLSSFKKQARLRADEKGKLVVSAQAGSKAGTAQGVHDETLLKELSAAPLLRLSLHEPVDEAGNAFSALHAMAKAEYGHLLNLFNRPLGHLARGIRQDEGQLKALWAGVCMHPKILENLSLFGDTLQRELVQARVSPSETISLLSSHSYRAHQNWLRTNSQINRWACDRRPLDLVSLRQVNAMLGEGLKPWNKAEQADRVGAAYGELRTVDVVSGIPPSYYLRADQVGQALRELFQWLEIQRIDAGNVVLIAASFYQRLVSIHPFSDGNGRTARLMLDWLLQQHGWPPVVLQADVALFPHGACVIQPGVVERALIDGLRKVIQIHSDALRLDEHDT